MGRTAVNFNGGVQASLIASKIEGELFESMLKKPPFVFLTKYFSMLKKSFVFLKNSNYLTKYFKNKKNKKNLK